MTRSPSLPRLHPHQRQPHPLVRRRGGATRCSSCSATSASPTPRPRLAPRRWPRACSPRAPARAPGSALLAPNGPEWIVGWLAATRIGCVVALLNTYSKAARARLDPAPRRRPGAAHRRRPPRPRLPRSPRAGRPRPRRPDPRADPHRVAPVPALRLDLGRRHAGRGPVPVADLAARGDGVSDGLLREVEAEVTPADPMVIVYSSGSTADPKGAMHSHGASVRHAHNLGQMRDLAADDVLYTPMPLFWVGGLQLHAHRRDARRRRPRVRGAVRAGRHARADRAGAASPRCWAGPTWPRRWSTTRRSRSRDLSSIRGGSYAALLPQDQQAERRGAEGQLARHDRDARPAHLRQQGHRSRPTRRARSGCSVPGVEHKIVDPVTLEDLPVGRDRRAVAARLLAHARAPQAGAGRHLHRRRLVPHRRRRATSTPTATSTSPGRMGDLIKSSGMNITPRDVELVLEAHARGGDGLRHRRAAPRPGPGRGGRHRAASRRDARRRRGPQAGEGGDRQLQGAAPHRRVRQPDRAARGSTPARSTAAGSPPSSKSGSRSA